MMERDLCRPAYRSSDRLELPIIDSHLPRNPDHNMLRPEFICLVVIAVVSISAPDCIAVQNPNEIPPAGQADFFESKIRPLLVNHCLECHGAENANSELRLDSRAAILRGGSSGDPGAISGQPDASSVLLAVRHEGDYDMPPGKTLSAQEIADLARWIDMGLPWPESSSTIAQTSMPQRILEHRKSHWAFQSIRRPPTPVALTSEPPPKRGHRVDHFIQAQLASRNLSLSPRADRRTLIRRATFDLTGLPPTYQQVESFIQDDDPDAYRNLIDRLLDSPHYGERWARHWLDVARYADTSGYTFDNGDRRYPFAFTYRDYVIDAFNNDLPYDQFIREQLAADHMDVPDDNRTLAALGFLTVGRKYIDPHDTIDDQVDVVTRGLMGLTVSCARCHDHKYDGIPTQDYYSLYSVFANNHVPDELPLIGNPKEQVEFKSYFDKLEQLKNEADQFSKSKHEEILAHIQENFTDYLARVIVPNQEERVTQQEFVKLKEAELRPIVLEKWRQYFAGKSTSDTTLLKPMLDLIGLPEQSFREDARRLIKQWSANESETGFNPILMARLNSQPPGSKIELARILGELFSETIEQWKKQGSQQPIVRQFKGPRRDIAALFFSPESPARLTRENIERYLNQGEGNHLRKLRAEVNQHNSSAPAGLVRAMVLRDNEPLRDQNVMIRGKGNEGELAPRRFVALLSGSDRPLFRQQSGRLDLANRIADPDNPLTARVLVNRVWMHHFSDPIVETPSDFGIRCPEPVHRELLDDLAADFVENGWSIKHLHREIMLSNTYCQSSIERPDCSAIDPENRLYWKMNRRRLEFEPLRDSILSVAGNLDSTLYGKPVELLQHPFVNRRSIYGFIDRQDLPNLFRVFDLANPDQSAARRIRTTVPQQSLFMMNSRFVMEQARHLVKSIPENQSAQARIAGLYQTVLQRNPTESELSIGLEFIRSSSPKLGDKNLGRWQRYAQLLLFTNEFEFID